MLARRIIYTLLGLLTIFVAFLVVAALAPKAYEGEITVAFPDRRIDIWNNLTSLETVMTRDPDVVRVEQLSESYEAVVWKEYLRNGDVRQLRVIERHPPEYFKVEQFKSDTGITGTWEYTLRQGPNYTTVVIKEQSYNDNFWVRGWHTLIGRNILLKREVKSLRVALFTRLIETP